MARLIDAEALVKALLDRSFYPTAVRRAIEKAPTIDAVPVVRCKDCKHRRDDEDYACGHYCVRRPHNGGYLCEDDDYCSYGERREDGDK